MADNPQDIATLKTIRSNLIQTIANAVAYELTNGPRVPYELDGEEYNFPEWYKMATAQVKTLTELITLLDGPFEIDSYAGPVVY